MISVWSEALSNLVTTTSHSHPHWQYFQLALHRAQSASLENRHSLNQSEGGGLPIDKDLLIGEQEIGLS
jgi:hypothetical protein